MLEALELKAIKRDSGGKGAARSIRRDGLVPAVLYGKNIDPLHLSIKPEQILEALKMPLGRNTLLNVAVEGDKNYYAIIKDAQFNVLSRKPEHFDLMLIEAGSPLEVAVPLALKGKSVGEGKGGFSTLMRRKAKVSCAPENIPTVIEIDISALEIGERILIADVKLPEGVKAVYKENFVVADVKAGRAALPEEGAPAAAAEAEPAAEGDAKADAAKAEAKPAAKKK